MRLTPTTRKRLVGITLVEMVVAIVVVGVIFGLGSLVLGRSIESYDLARKTTDTDWQGRVAIERLARELRDIRTRTAADLAFNATEIRFTNADGNGVCFRQSGSTLQRSADGPAGVCGTTNPQPLADNVVPNGFNINYYDDAGNTTAVAAQVYYISLSLQVSRDSIGETYRLTVQPRRF